ncbi:hypothetical protein [Dolichospermum circinale]|uniref:hypothetical protein n=1 Tax=Dolichospermum circinale TaxID=109265 RepID=UPI00232F83A1|nr:hypothetical protein [Dolichospermum circinale]MDB9454301.1 hypothetical protein [Dolichospermum circinale CS-541/06]MDB9461264.1 hypothetical protein [Dolichospermum circinale CS-541/04]MDB9546223.1 hypothetical protein [Dolichospermum circinale CS-1031]
MLLINSENQNLLKTNFLAHTLVQTEKKYTDDWYIQFPKTYQEKNWLTEDAKPSDKFGIVSKFYTIENILAVNRFLQNHANLIDVILEAHPQIRKYFPTEKLRLKLYIDPESSEWEYLIISICVSPESVDEALNKQNEFDENWWLNASLGVAVNLSIDLEFE